MHKHLLSVDLEDWVHSGHLRDYIKPEQATPRITESTLPVLDLLERKNVTSTFFILGSLAEKNRDLIREIARRGHELASHSYDHTRLSQLSPDQFRQAIRKTNDILEDISGEKVIGFRAPFASLDQETAWALDILEEEGFEYDSSIFPIRTPIYGVKGAPVSMYRIHSSNILADHPEGKLLEIPFTVYKAGPLSIPCTGGIYGRFLPTPLLTYLLRHTGRSRPINFYFHPWETDPNMPRISAPFYNRMVVYYNTGNYLRKIEHILDLFSFTSFRQYLTEKEIVRTSLV